MATSAQVYRDLTLGQTYEWYVRFRNEYAWGNQSEHWRFMVGNSLACASVTEIPQSECDALATLFTSTNGANWLDKNGWLVTNTPCSWHGVTCAGGHVTRLELWRNRLDGTIPAELSNLDHLVVLALGGNSPLHGGNLRGAIPAELGSLSSLQMLNFYDNELTGSIPPSIGSLAQLSGLTLSFNHLSGSIPPELGGLQSLALLQLRSNELSGMIPRSLGNLAGIRYTLDLGLNNLSGPIPAEFGQLTQLESLYLDNNQLTDMLPAELGDMTAIQTLYLSHNRLNGSIPPGLGSLAQLLNLTLSFNYLSGSIPPELGQLQSLAVLDLSGNELSGVIPGSLGSLGSIRYWLDLSSNNLSGPIPIAFGQLTQLESLYLDNNQLAEALPAELGDMAALQSLSLSNNRFTGAPPGQLSNLGNLRDLRIDHNPLDGALPDEWTRLTLNRFSFQETGLCEPSDVAFQDWLASIPNLQRTGNTCATLVVNFPAGAPGSYFLLTGSGYPPDADATVTANGNVVGTVPTNTGGEFSFRLETPDADPGFYVVTASVNPAASTYLHLSLDQPVRPLEGNGPILNVPSGIALDNAVFLPVVWR